VQVPDESAKDGRLAFVILAAEGIEVMYQTVTSITGDTVASASDKQAFRLEPQQTTLYIEVGDLAQVESRLKGERLVMPRRKTFYGATEVGYADPAGNIVHFLRARCELKRRALLSSPRRHPRTLSLATGRCVSP